MAQSKETDDGHAGGEGQAHRCGDQDAENQNRKKNALLNEGDFEMGHSHRATQHHHADESGRHRPKCATAKLHGPETDREHCEQMIETAQRVDESMGEARATMAWMGLSEDRNEHQR